MRTSLVSGVMFVLLLSVSAAQAQSGHPMQAVKNAGPEILSHVTKIKSVKFVLTGLQPPADADCRTVFAIPCYSPQEIRNAYGLTPILQAGYTGRGQTIIIIDSFGSPTIAQDLQAFDAAFGLPDPPSFKVLAPLGSVPFDPTNSTQVGWAFEATLDVEWAHAIAPGANIVLMTSPVAETEGVQGLPEFLALEKYALHNKLGKIISQSWAATENTLTDAAGQQIVDEFEDFYQHAVQENVTVLASAGDTGSSNVDVNNNIYPNPTVNFPASSPLVTGVGGTSLYADTSGKYLFEIVWNDFNGNAGGGGVSQLFAEPPYQYSLPSSVQQPSIIFVAFPMLLTMLTGIPRF